MAVATFELASEKATQKAGQILGELLRAEPIGKRALVLALEGELGAGKTTFVRGLAKGLDICEKITSPSFLMAKRYRFSSLRGAQRRSNPKKSVFEIASPASWRARNDGKGRAFWHFDFYRFNQAVTRRDLTLLNFSEIIRDPQHIIAIEWAERVIQFLPKNRFTFHFEVMGQMQRRLVITGRS